MAQKLIRDIPDETMTALEAKAAAAGQNTEAWIRDLLIQAAAEPIVKERYAIRFSNDTGLAGGMLRRFRDVVERVGFYGLSIEGLQVIEQVEALMRRNNAGDREEAIYLLKCHFNSVFEVPV